MAEKTGPTFRSLLKRPGMKTRMFYSYILYGFMYGLLFGLAQVIFSDKSNDIWNTLLVSLATYGVAMGFLGPYIELSGIQRKEKAGRKQASPQAP